MSELSSAESISKADEADWVAPLFKDDEAERQALEQVASALLQLDAYCRRSGFGAVAVHLGQAIDLIDAALTGRMVDEAL